MSTLLTDLLNVSFKGPQGVQGSQGIQGLKGLDGSFAGQGVQGLQGPQGPQGSQGLQGLDGAFAGQGVQGSFGSQGVQGTQGVQGRQGTQGLDGAFAGQGVQGSSGYQGVQGRQGTQGLDGAFAGQGVQGSQGVQGRQGTQGLDGAFAGQGVQGSQGVQGILGRQGTQGLSGLFAGQGVQGSQGPQGILGRQGTQGLDGAFAGQGVQGSQGTQGRQGSQGIQGVAGFVGSSGAQGTQGSQGTQGLDGAFAGQGIQGSQGIQGLQGLQGTQGLQGLQGVQGSQGVQGTQGSSGIVVVDDTTTNATRYLVFEDQTSGVSDTDYVSSTKLVYNPSTGNVGIGTTKPTTDKLYVGGNIKVTGTIIGSSNFSVPRGKGIKAKNPDDDNDDGEEFVSDKQCKITGISTFTVGPVLIGSASSTGTETQPLQVTGGTYISGNVGLGTTTPTSKIHVIGDGLVSGVVTATTFSGQVNVGVGTITTLTSTNGTIVNLSGTNLSYSGISTFTNGPVLIGSGSSTGTASQRLQITGGTYVSGNLGVGTTNPTQNFHVQGNLRITGGLYDSNNTVGVANSVLISTGAGVSWSVPGAGVLAARTIVTGVTTQLSANGIGNTDISGFKTYGLLKIGISTAAWVRLYTDSTSRTNDASRSIEVDPDTGSGVLAEFVTTGISTIKVTPFIMGFNDDNPVTSVIYVSVKNLSSISTSITVDLTILKLEE